MNKISPRAILFIFHRKDYTQSKIINEQTKERKLCVNKKKNHPEENIKYKWLTNHTFIQFLICDTRINFKKQQNKTNEKIPDDDDHHQCADVSVLCHTHDILFSLNGPFHIVVVVV